MPGKGKIKDLIDKARRKVSKKYKAKGDAKAIEKYRKASKVSKANRRMDEKITPGSQYSPNPSGKTYNDGGIIQHD
tara:strand:+ start:478 stop:705 length:228 start_codon:yes stop_codon:yes gene_type:complete